MDKGEKEEEEENTIHEALSQSNPGEWANKQESLFHGENNNQQLKVKEKSDMHKLNGKWRCWRWRIKIVL